MKRLLSASFTLTLIALIATPAMALVNPSMQPRHLYDLHQNIMACRVTSVDARELTITLSVEGVAKGEFDADEVVMSASRDELASLLAVEEGQLVVVFAGKRRAPEHVLYYAGGGKWYEATIDANDDSQWQLTGDADEGTPSSSDQIMFGVFNGAVDQLWQMTRDLAAGTAYFPADPFTRFTARQIDQLDDAVGGVALFDLNADGRLDILVTSAAGNRVYLQDEAGEFEDRTDALGLADTASQSVSVADANADGRADLLLDGVLFLKQDEGPWTRTDLVPEQDGTVVSAAFVELTGDGYPDIVISRAGAGLAAYANPFSREDDTGEVPFENLTEQLGLDEASHGSGGDGYLEAGDFDSDGRTDLLYLSGPGYLLLRQDDGFESITIGWEGDEYDFGTAAIAPFIDPARNGAIILLDDTKMLVEYDEEQAFREVTRYGNEIQDDVPGLLTVIANDLNADGTIDLYAGNRGHGSTAFFCTNRGYGSFLLEEKYAGGQIVPPSLYNLPTGGLAAGDVTGDGANDILVGGDDGAVWLLVNQTAQDRPEQPDPATPLDVRKQIETRIATVRLDRPVGAVNAWLRLHGDEGELVAARQLGGNIGLGSAGPQQVSFAVREPGAYTLEVTFADGETASQAVDLSETQPRHQVITISGVQSE
ncbi:MAG: FG-GAP-like repeat-containing protein [Phycisphaeraceae bacterium]